AKARAKYLEQASSIYAPLPTSELTRAAISRSARRTNLSEPPAVAGGQVFTLRPLAFQRFGLRAQIRTRSFTLGKNVPYGPNRCRYSIDETNALTISASMKLPLKLFSLFSQKL